MSSDNKPQLSAEQQFVYDNAEWLSKWFDTAEQIAEPQRGFQRFVLPVNEGEPIQKSITRMHIKIVEALIFSRDLSKPDEEFNPLTSTCQGFVAQKGRLPTPQDNVRLMAYEWFFPEWDPKRRIYLRTTIGIKAL